tara:strand:+ start:345 stop:521 length:177 start_codon:yes stop_codon:yes gene_type:complete
MILRLRLHYLHFVLEQDLQEEYFLNHRVCQYFHLHHQIHQIHRQEYLGFLDRNLPLLK